MVNGSQVRVFCRKKRTACVYGLNVCVHCPQGRPNSVGNVADGLMIRYAFWTVHGLIQASFFRDNIVLRAQAFQKKVGEIRGLVDLALGV